MISIDFQQYFKALESGVADVAKQTAGEYVSQAKTDGQNVLNLMKANLERWTQEIANGEMSLDDLKFLVQSQKELDEMNALKEAGLAAVEIDKFKNGLISMTIDTITSFL